MALERLEELEEFRSSFTQELFMIKNKAVSRIRNKIVFILFMVFLILFLFGYMMKSNLLFCLAISIFIAACILLMITNRCPNCGEYFRGIYWSKSAGYCRKCGEKICFDDEVNKK